MFTNIIITTIIIIFLVIIVIISNALEMFFIGLCLFPCGITVSFVIRRAKKAVKKNKHKKNFCTFVVMR